jgi:predicted RNase H-like nuclease
VVDGHDGSLFYFFLQHSTIYTCGEDGCVRVWKEDAGNVQAGAQQAEEKRPTADTGPKAAREQRHEAATPERRKEEKRKGKKRGFKPY